MQTALATTGTSALLEQLSAFIPDALVNDLLPAHRGRGRRRHWSPAQLCRLLLLTLLTPAHSTNLLLQLLPEQRAWRKFARLPNRVRLPTASQLHDFRRAIGVSGLRRVNEHLLGPLLVGLRADRQSVGLMDATDLPAATSAYKKSSPASIRPGERRWAGEPSRRARAAGSSATSSTPCGCGSSSGPVRCC